MRLWHKDLIDVLPKQQLLGQWRECCLIARQINVLGRPNHILVNKIMDYPTDHFIRYACKVYHEMKNRGYSCNFKKFIQYFPEYDADIVLQMNPRIKSVFPGWHDSTYLDICYYNLLEKYKCGGIRYDEWTPIAIRMGQF